MSRLTDKYGYCCERCCGPHKKYMKLIKKSLKKKEKQRFKDLVEREEWLKKLRF